MMNLLNADFTCTYVSTPAAPVVESCQSKFTQVPMFNTRTDEWHWNVSALQCENYVQETGLNFQKVYNSYIYCPDIISWASNGKQLTQ